MSKIIALDSVRAETSALKATVGSNIRVVPESTMVGGLFRDVLPDTATPLTLILFTLTS